MFFFLSVITKTKENLGKTAFIHEELIESSKKGSDKARYQLYQLYSKAMFNVCYRMLGHREDAEDMLQEVFVQVFQKLESFRYESSFGSWLKTITINSCINFLNKRKTELVYCDEIYRHDRVQEEDEKVELTTENVLKAMEDLPEGGRLVFSLYLLEGYDHSEISQILNITESTSKTQYMRAKRRVYENLKNQKIWAS